MKSTELSAAGPRAGASAALLCLLCLFMLLPWAVLASPPEEQQDDELVPALSPVSALSLACEASPELRLAVFELRQRELELEREQGRYAAVLTSSLDAQHSAQPTRTGDGVTAMAQSAVQASVGVADTYSTGAVLSAELQAGWSQTPGEAVQDGSMGLDLLFRASQPLLRGAGSEVMLSSLHSAELSLEYETIAQRRTASAVARDVLLGYWGLWYAERELQIQEQALALSEAELQEAEQRVALDASPASELIALKMELASGREQLSTAQGAVLQRSVELSVLLGRPAQREPLSTDGEEPAVAPMPSLEALQQRALEASLELQGMRLEVDSLRIQEELALDDEQLRLDAMAWVQLSGMGDPVLSAFGQLGSLGAVSAFVGLELELPFDNSFRERQSDLASLAVSSAALRVELAEEQLRAELVQRVNAIEQAQLSLELARETVSLAQQNVENQRQRLRLAESTSLELARAIQSLREAELRVARAQLSLVSEQLRLSDSTDDLLDAVAMSCSQD
jgi:outer membrane protein TolC